MPTLEETLAGLSAEDLAELDKLALADKAAVVWRPLLDVNDVRAVTPQRQAYESLADELLYGGAAGGGKLLDIDEVLPTPDGWARVGNIQVGDVLFDEKGKQCRVLALSPIDPTPISYRLAFDDGSFVDACADHRWLTFDASELAALTRIDSEWRARRRVSRPSRAGSVKSEKFRQAITARNQANARAKREPPTGTVRTTAQIAATLTTGSGRRNHTI